MASLEKDREKLVAKNELVQKKAFTKWVNTHLEKAKDSIEDLFIDLRSGVKLLILIQMLTGQKQPQQKGTMKFHKLINVKTALTYLTDVKKIKLYGISADAIVDGKPTSTLGLVWMLILNFQLSSSSPQQEQTSSERTPEVSMTKIKQELLQWARKQTEGYDEVNITNFTSSWRDGMAFCAIISRHRPDLLDYDECDPDQPLDNIKKAFAVAEKELGVPSLLDPEDVNVEKPSEKPILMYVDSLRNKLKEMPPPHRREVFKEDIATRQPEVNALNKMAGGCNSQSSLTPVTVQGLHNGFTMNHVETEETADHFDHNGSDDIDLSESNTVHEGPKIQTMVEPMTDDEKIDHEIQVQVAKCSCPNKFKVSRVDKENLKFGDSQKLRGVRILQCNVMVRVGGGWMSLKEFLDRHDPCRIRFRRI